MLAKDSSSPSVAALFATWLSVTGQLMRAIGSTAERKLDDFPDLVKDSCLDFSGTPRPQEPTSVPLPPVDPGELMAALRDSIQETLCRATALINDDPLGLWSAVTEEHVLALFTQLAAETLARALDLRLAAMAAPSKLGRSHGEWRRKYLRMAAGGSCWSAPESASDSPAIL